jgi:hypothetical protein
MGSFVTLKIGKYDFLMNKNSFGGLLMIFSKEDRRVETIEKNGEVFSYYTYQTTVKKAKRVLDVIGHSLISSEECFNNFLYYLVQEEGYEYTNFSLDEIKSNFTFNSWIKAVKKYAVLLSKNGYEFYEKVEKVKKECNSVAELFVLESLSFGAESYFGIDYEYANLFSLFRVTLEAFSDETNLVLDYTDLYLGGWCDEYPEEKEFEVSKTIILTEGTFDAKAINESLKILYPELCKCYSFIDFDGYNVNGSTNFLTHYIKAFIAAGVQNRVIAIYDNDSAGFAELKNLSSLQIPKHFRIMTLPDIEIANDYPTLGPNGKENMNINKLACSIEFFLGKDGLKDKDEFIPIQWTGYIEKTKTYQGVIMKKREIQKRFERKISSYNESNPNIKQNWVEMDQLLNAIITAFN